MFYYGVQLITKQTFKDSELKFMQFDDYSEYLTYKFHPEWIIFESEIELDFVELQKRFLKELKKHYI